MSLAELKALSAAARKRPWAYSDCGQHADDPTARCWKIRTPSELTPLTPDEYRFIVSAVNSHDALLALAEAAKAVVDSVRWASEEEDEECTEPPSYATVEALRAAVRALEQPNE